MLASLAARLRAAHPAGGVVWVDLGGGTGANVAAMFDLLPPSFFAAVHVVDLCAPLAAVARDRVRGAGWTNVTVHHGDATAWRPPAGATADAVTFSYSLSMMPPFHDAVDAALAYLTPAVGLVGVADFYVSAKHDHPHRQHSFARRTLWRATFETDGIFIGPERRAYLDHKLERVWEINGDGPIPYVPYLRAPWYAWVGRVDRTGATHVEPAPETPAAFPPTFLYHTSWEDSAVDRATLKPGPGDRVLTLTSGGDNAMAYLLHGVDAVVAVDMNPAQSALLELKAAAVRALPYADLWRLLGEGRHPAAAGLFETAIAPWLSQAATAFWRPRVAKYFDPARGGLYMQGGHGGITRAVRAAAAGLGLLGWLEGLATAPTLADQVKTWEAGWPVRFFTSAPQAAVRAASSVLAFTLFNRVALWFGAGVPANQYRMIEADTRMSTYVARTLNGAARTIHCATDNPYYYISLMARMASPEAAMEYLKPANAAALAADGGALLDRLAVVTAPFLDALAARGPFSIVILMDHVDWTDAPYAKTLAAALAANVPRGGRVIWRSAALEPWYAPIFAAAGFDVRCVARADTAPGGYLDRVNSYASFYVAVKK